jgi:hypothetical protein
MAPVWQGADNGLFSTAGKDDNSYQVSVTLDNVSTAITIHVNKLAPVIKVADKNGKELKSNSDVSSNFEAAILVSDLNGMAASSIRVLIDNLEVKSTDVKVSALDASAQSYRVDYKTSTPLAAGAHTLTIIARDQFGRESTVSISELNVHAAASAVLHGNYPNPARFDHGQTTTIKYTLTADADIVIRFYDLAGRQVLAKSYASGSSGGSTGDNYATFDGVNAFGQILSNGVYHYFITANGKSLAHGILAVND